MSEPNERDHVELGKLAYAIRHGRTLQAAGVVAAYRAEIERDERERVLREVEQQIACGPLNTAPMRIAQLIACLRAGKE